MTRDDDINKFPSKENIDYVAIFTRLISQSYLVAFPYLFLLKHPKPDDEDMPTR